MPEELRYPIDPRQYSNTEVRPTTRKRWPIFLLLAIFSVTLGVIINNSQSPEFFKEKVVEIPGGYGGVAIASLLKKEGLIKSETLFLLSLRYFGNETSIPAGTYLFKEPMNVMRVAARFSEGDHGISRMKITIPEGLTAREMADIFAGNLPRFDKTEFIANAEKKEGYLFPDTYFFFSNATSGPVIEALDKTFILRTKDLQVEASIDKKNWHDIITMASIIEEEAVTSEDRRLVSGILWSRMDKGMRLQVDAPFVYLLGKGSAELSVDDLKTDSPYNTYTHDGLPPAAIANPSLDAIDAALHPTETKYLYYLSGLDGTMHYAKTFEEHKVNKEKYIR
jgi:UPF0755 protein